jgi:hypothetical protein
MAKEQQVQKTRKSLLPLHNLNLPLHNLNLPLHKLNLRSHKQTLHRRLLCLLAESRFQHLLK